MREFLQRAYGLDVPNIVIEQPPKIEFGEYALPIAFELARKLRKAPAQDCRRNRRRNRHGAGL